MWFGAVLGLTCYLCHAQSDYNAVQSELFRKHNANKEKKAFPQCEGGQHEGEKQGVITKLGHTKINDRDKVMIVSFSIVCPSCGMTPCFFSSLCFVPSLYATSGKERYPSQQKNVVSYVAMGGSLVQVKFCQNKVKATGGKLPVCKKNVLFTSWHVYFDHFFNHPSTRCTENRQYIPRRRNSLALFAVVYTKFLCSG